jgi:hypothetical protein
MVVPLDIAEFARFRDSLLRVALELAGSGLPTGALDRETLGLDQDSAGPRRARPERAHQRAVPQSQSANPNVRAASTCLLSSDKK